MHLDPFICSGNTAFIAACVPTGTKAGRRNIAVGRVNDAGAAVSGTVSPKPAGRGWQAGDRFEMEGAAVAGLSGLCAQRMFKKADRHMFTLGRRGQKRAGNCEELGFEGRISPLPERLLPLQGAPGQVGRLQKWRNGVK